ncbi:hypothetical protein PUNSTDRAFT_56960, partial [Punctularia strigosozonata HHB-11173 SS5]|uniref:uncharacterized protein n=1 Tax=Punctularia strigosozonata (strain HHB-11173) TaxID=741275 RepID=UPI0004416436
MNPDPIPDPSFDHLHHELNRLLVACMPERTQDRTLGQHFSRLFETGDVEWLKKRLHDKGARGAAGVDDASYGDLMAIPNAQLLYLYNDYRIIGLECCLLKGLTLLIERRIRTWAAELNIIPRSQNGFRPGYRTNNNAFIFRSMVEACRAKGQTLYVAVMDLTNAFPRTDHDTLWSKLYRMGASGPLID